MRAFITGISGFVGSHLAIHLEETGWDVFGFDVNGNGRTENLFEGEITDENALRHALNDCRPDVVFHLAGIIKPSDVNALYAVNLLGTIALLDQIMGAGISPTVVVAGSSAVYGYAAGGMPIGERTQMRPITHYAVSKAAQEVASLRYFDSFQLPVKIIRMFNLLGPGQSPDLACSAFARQIAMAEAGGNDEIVTGDLSANRDFVDVRDAAHAFSQVAEKGRAGQVYNVCSGRAVLIRTCLDQMLSMSSHPLRVRVDARRSQKEDIPAQVGSARKINRVTGWHPAISLEQSLSDLLAYWREKVQFG